MYITGDPDKADLDAELAEVVEAWPTLSKEVKRRILDIVDAAKDGEQ